MRKPFLYLILALILISFSQGCVVFQNMFKSKKIVKFDLEVSETVKVCPNNFFLIKGVAFTEGKETYTTDTRDIVRWSDIELDIKNNTLL